MKIDSKPSVESSIQQKLTASLSPSFLKIENESHKHSRPPGSESHFRVIVVSDIFNGLSRVQRQQKVFEILENEMRNFIHALSQFTFTSDEWLVQKHNFDIQSPECQHKTSV
jgi:BolA protein